MVESRGLPINPIYSTTVVSSLPWLFWKNNYRKQKYWINTITNNSLFYCVNKLRQQPKNCCFSHANWSTGLVSHNKLSGQIAAEYTPIIFSLVHNYTKKNLAKDWVVTELLQMTFPKKLIWKINNYAMCQCSEDKQATSESKRKTVKNTACISTSAYQISLLFIG